SASKETAPASDACTVPPPRCSGTPGSGPSASPAASVSSARALRPRVETPAKKTRGGSPHVAPHAVSAPLDQTLNTTQENLVGARSKKRFSELPPGTVRAACPSFPFHQSAT